MLKKILLANALIEILGAVLLLFKPSLLIDSAEITQATAGVLRMYGIVAIIIAAISLQCYRFFEHTSIIKIISLCFVAFHLMIGMQLHTMFRSGTISMAAPAFFHLVVGFGIAIFYYQEKALFLANETT